MSRYSCPELPVWVSPQAVVGVASALPVPPGAADKSQALLISLLFYPWVLGRRGLRAETGAPTTPHPAPARPWVPPAGPYLAMGAFLEGFRNRGIRNYR